MTTEQLQTPSLRRRVTVTVLVLVAVMLLVLAVATDLVLRNRLDAQLRDRLLDRAAVADALVDQVEPDDLVRRLEGDGISVRLRSSDGRRYSAGPLRVPESDRESPSGTAPAPTPPGGPAGGPPGPADAIVEIGDLLAVTTELGDGSRLTLLADAGEVRRTSSQVRIALLVAAVVVLALAAIVLGPVIARALGPLEHITNVARSISAGDRGQRLRPDRPRTELGRTAAAFDDMLDVVEGAEQHAVESEHRLRTFLSDAAHELRTPLTGVQAAAEHVLRAAPDRAERERIMVTLVREARRAGRLVDDMLLMGRIDQGLELRLSEVDLHEVARTVADAHLLTNPHATLTVSGDRLTVRADHDRIAQVLSNLVDNALHSTHGAGAVDIDVSVSDGSAVVDVTDNGPGVRAVDRERIFERLVRLDSARTHHRGGAGLGLPIARGIAQAHGGQLRYLDRSGAAGASFRLTLPR